MHAHLKFKLEKAEINNFEGKKILEEMYNLHNTSNTFLSWVILRDAAGGINRLHYNER